MRSEENKKNATTRYTVRYCTCVQQRQTERRRQPFLETVSYKQMLYVSDVFFLFFWAPEILQVLFPCFFYRQSFVCRSNMFCCFFPVVQIDAKACIAALPDCEPLVLEHCLLTYSLPANDGKESSGVSSEVRRARAQGGGRCYSILLLPWA